MNTQEKNLIVKNISVYICRIFLIIFNIIRISIHSCPVSLSDSSMICMTVFNRFFCSLWSISPIFYRLFDPTCEAAHLFLYIIEAAHLFLYNSTLLL